MKKLLFISLAVILLVSCRNTGNGELIGVEKREKFYQPDPFGMTYVPMGSYTMGSGDQDVPYAHLNNPRTITVTAFWMDETEITNNEYRQFVIWVRDSVIARNLGYVKAGADGEEHVDWNKMKTVKLGDPKIIEQLANTPIILTPEDRLNGKKEIDPTKLIYYSDVFDLKEAAQRKNAGQARSKFITKNAFPFSIAPDTLCWIRDFAYSYNEPMTKRYFSHPALFFAGLGPFQAYPARCVGALHPRTRFGAHGKWPRKTQR